MTPTGLVAVTKLTDVPNGWLQPGVRHEIGTGGNKCHRLPTVAHKHNHSCGRWLHAPLPPASDNSGWEQVTWLAKISWYGGNLRPVDLLGCKLVTEPSCQGVRSLQHKQPVWLPLKGACNTTGTWRPAGRTQVGLGGVSHHSPSPLW